MLMFFANVFERARIQCLMFQVDLESWRYSRENRKRVGDDRSS